MTGYRVPNDDMIEVNDPSETADVADEDVADQFWSTHCFGPGMLARADRVNPHLGLPPGGPNVEDEDTPISAVERT